MTHSDGKLDLAVGDIVETAKGAKFWGKIIGLHGLGLTELPGAVVEAIDPGFAGVRHVYPLIQLVRRTPPAGAGEVVAWVIDYDDGDRDVAADRNAADAMAAAFTGVTGGRATVQPLYAAPVPTNTVGGEVAARDMATAPKDGSMLRLLVKYDHADMASGPMDDVEGPSWTIGFNGLGDTGDDRWQIAGWDWEQDCFRDSSGTPIGWLPFLASPDTTSRDSVYIASKTKHAARWRALRDQGAPINSTWIDEAGEGESQDLNDLWRRCLAEASGAGALVIYREPDEVLKGGWVELGAAASHGVPVFAVGLREFTISKHQSIQHFDTFDEALTAALRALSTRSAP